MEPLIGVTVLAVLLAGAWLFLRAPDVATIDIDADPGHVPHGAVRPIYGRPALFDWQGEVPELADERIADIVEIIPA